VNWTGSQWSTGFFVNVTIGLITAGDSVIITATNPRFVRALIGTQRVDVAARWQVLSPVDFPTIVYAQLSDAVAGDVDLLLFNQLAGDTDFGDRDVYFEFSAPYYVP
jgi:hypothetical protein